MKPTSIFLIGAIFVLCGLLAAWEVLADLFRNRININFAVCLFFVGLGLLRLKGSSRRWAIFWLVLGYGFVALMVAGYFWLPDYHITWSGSEVEGPLRPLIGIGLPSTLALLFAWMHYSLCRPHVVALFSTNLTSNKPIQTDRPAAGR